VLQSALSRSLRLFEFSRGPQPGPQFSGQQAGESANESAVFRAPGNFRNEMDVVEGHGLIVNADAESSALRGEQCLNLVAMAEDISSGFQYQMQRPLPAKGPLRFAPPQGELAPMPRGNGKK
jgi:hypothetical protein